MTRLSSKLECQRQRLEDRLRQGPATTIQIRKELDIIAPAARIFELRRGKGLNIITRMINAETLPGSRHKVAEYVLLADPVHIVDDTEA